MARPFRLVTLLKTETYLSMDCLFGTNNPPNYRRNLLCKPMYFNNNPDAATFI
jgi:hypothetical protein